MTHGSPFQHILCPRYWEDDLLPTAYCLLPTPRVLTWRHADETLELTREVALVDEARFGRDA